MERPRPALEAMPRDTCPRLQELLGSCRAGVPCGLPGAEWTLGWSGAGARGLSLQLQPAADPERKELEGRARRLGWKMDTQTQASPGRRQHGVMSRGHHTGGKEGLTLGRRGNGHRLCSVEALATDGPLARPTCSPVLRPQSSLPGAELVAAWPGPRQAPGPTESSEGSAQAHILTPRDPMEGETACRALAPRTA